MHNQSKWVEHTKLQKAQSALSRHSYDKINYGEQVYCSPAVNDVSWVVSKYQDEYNVFTDSAAHGKKHNRAWVACFRGEQVALDFALRMVLICSGKMRRKDLQTI